MKQASTRYGILCRNNGIWNGMESWLQQNGEIISFDTMDEAKKKAQAIRDTKGNINNFTQYFPMKIVNKF